MRPASLAVVVIVLAGGVGCATRAAAPLPEPELPVMQPPPAPPRIVVIYTEPAEPLLVATPPPAEPASPARAEPKPSVPAPSPEPAATEAPPSVPPPALTLTPAPGVAAKTEASIRVLLDRASSDLGRVNVPGLSSDGRTQFEAARRFVQQAEEALKARNLVYAGKLADKAAVMAAALVR